jgi:hypothetical protein
VIGPALSLFAVLLWGFVVAGQFTTSWVTGAPLSQGVAVTFVLLTTNASWLFCIRRSCVVAPPLRSSALVGRAVAIAALAIVFFFASIFAATMVGQLSSNNHDLLIAFGLVTASTLAATAGPRLTSPLRPELTHRQRFLLVVAWMAGALLTVVAGVDLAANANM